MKVDTDVLIVGGGLNGSSLALALAQAGHRVTLVERLSADLQADAKFDGRGYALALTSQRMLSALGIWEAVREFSQPILDIKVSDGRAGEGAAPWYLHFDHTEIEEGPMGQMLEDRYLRRALLDALADTPNVVHWPDEEVTDHVVEQGFVRAQVASGGDVAARLIVGCDGQRSAVAERASIRRTGWDYHQTSLVCAIAHEHPHQGCAHQFFMPSGPLAILPLPGNRSSIVWTEETGKALEINKMSDEAYLDCLRPCFGDFLGDIALAGSRFSYPLGLSLAQSFIADRLALVGDAAHGIHPLAGQGLNLGLRDVAALAEVLTGATRRGEDIGAVNVLARYQQWRRFDTTALAATTDGINRLFSNDNPLVRATRDIGLGVANTVPAVRRGLIRQAAGLTGDLPKLMQGQQI